MGLSHADTARACAKVQLHVCAAANDGSSFSRFFAVLSTNHVVLSAGVMADHRRANASSQEARQAVLRGFKRNLLDKGYEEKDWNALADESDVDECCRREMNSGLAHDDDRIQTCVERVLGAGRLLRYEV